MRATAVIYILWAVFMVSLGSYIVHRFFDPSNPKSLTSSLNQLNKSINEDP